MNIDELIQQREKQIQTEKEKEKQLEEKAKLIIKEFLQHTENFVFKFEYIKEEYLSLKKSFVLSLDRKKYGFDSIKIYRISLRDCVTLEVKSCNKKTLKDKIFHFFGFKKNELPEIIYKNKITYRVCCYRGDKNCVFKLNENQDFEKIFKLQELGVFNNAVCR